MTDEKITNLMSIQVLWLPTGNARMPYRVALSGQSYVIRINDFPEEQAYTLLRENGEKVLDFDTWPPLWMRP